MTTTAETVNTLGIQVGDPAIIRREGGTLYRTTVTRVTKTQFTAGLEGHRFYNSGRPVNPEPGAPTAAATPHHTDTHPTAVRWDQLRPAQELGLRLVGDSTPHVYQKAGEYLGTVGPVHRGIMARSERTGQTNICPDYAMALQWLQSTPPPAYGSREYFLQGYRALAAAAGEDYVDLARYITSSRTAPEDMDDESLSNLYAAAQSVS